LQIVLFLDRLSTPNPARIAIICPTGTPAISAALPGEAVTVNQSFLAAPKQNGQSSREFKFQQFAGVDPVLVVDSYKLCLFFEGKVRAYNKG
jgi:hypothetical protein